MEFHCVLSRNKLHSSREVGGRDAFIKIDFFAYQPQAPIVDKANDDD